MSDNECGACGRPVNGAFLCNGCIETLEKAIAELPADYRDLELVAARQARGPLGLGAPGRVCERYNLTDRDVPWEPPGPHTTESLGDAPWEFAPGAADQMWAADNTLSTWVRHLCESRGIDPPRAERGVWLGYSRLVIERNRAARLILGRFWIPSPEQPVAVLTRWLLDNLNAIRQDEAAPQIYEEITGLHAENERWILGRSGLEVFAGRCDAAEVTFQMDDSGALVPVATTCGAALYGYENEPDVRCNACGMKYPLQQRLAEMRERQINEQLARAHTIANALTTIEEPLSPTLLRKWIQRDAMAEPSPEGPACEDCAHRSCALIRRPLILEKSRDADGHALYRVGDVRARLKLVQEQRGMKLSA